MREYCFRAYVCAIGSCKWVNFFHIQLFRERLSEKVHAAIPKGIVGGFEFTVLQRKSGYNGTRGHGHMFASAKGKQQK